MGVGVYLLAGPAVVCLAALGGYFGERLGGGLGFWVGCYLAGIAAAALVGLLFARLFRGHPFHWAFGAVGLLAGEHLTWFALDGKTSEAPAGGSDQFLMPWIAAALARLDAPNLDRGSHREDHLDQVEQALAAQRHAEPDGGSSGGVSHPPVRGRTVRGP